MSIFSKKSVGGNDTAAVIKEFNALKNGDPLPREGLCGAFYNYFSYAGETMPLKYKKKYVFFHIENDDVIQEITSGIPSWHIQRDNERSIVSLLFKTGAIMNHIQLTLDANRQESAEILKFLKDDRKIEINLLNFVYGKIIKEKTLVIPIPKNITEELKKAVG